MIAYLLFSILFRAIFPNYPYSSQATEHVISQFSAGLHQIFNLYKLKHDSVMNETSTKYNLFIGHKHKIDGGTHTL